MWQAYALSVLAGLTIVATFLEMVGIFRVLPAQALEIVVLAILGSFVPLILSVLSTQRQHLHDINEKLGADRFLSTEDAIYDGAIGLIGDKEFDRVRLYAPVGFWKESQSKERWLKAVAEALKQGRVGEAKMVFGLPPSEERADGYWHSCYGNRRNSLSRFSDIENALIAYIPPLPAPEMAPNLGMLIFGEEYLAFGVASRESQWKVDTGWMTADKRIVKAAVQWFDGNVWNALLRKGYALKTRDQELHQGFSQVERNHCMAVASGDTSTVRP